MKKVIFFLIIATLTTPLYAATGERNTILKPSLTLQMNKNTVIVKENIKNQKLLEAKQRIAANKSRLAAVAQKNSTKSSTSTSLQTSTPTILTPKIQVASFITNKPTTTVSPTHSDTPAYTYSNTVKNVDLNAVRNAWLTWTNSARSELGLSPYTLDTSLNATATEWSEYSKNRGYIIHGRPGDGCTGVGNYSCYNFSAVDSWFKERGVDPVVINRTKHTENIGYGAYRCSGSDCTSVLINSIQSTFNYFMSEKGKSYDLHYRSITQQYFTKIGIGIAVDESKGVYYLTVHYITK